MIPEIQVGAGSCLTHVVFEGRRFDNIIKYPMITQKGLVCVPKLQLTPTSNLYLFIFFFLLIDAWQTKDKRKNIK